MIVGEKMVRLADLAGVERFIDGIVDDVTYDQEQISRFADLISGGQGSKHRLLIDGASRLELTDCDARVGVSLYRAVIGSENSVLYVQESPGFIMALPPGSFLNALGNKKLDFVVPGQSLGGYLQAGYNTRIYSFENVW